ncbi:ATP-binding protein [Bacillus sp. DTU_2020_1000418_1_SI_GHA_SEK_038]|uniref:sensor histidine kinase n=1 Tax=Bacillus sp. DTU_2020_1000418_1_SI_GHA_SEK_038 TaxID=3077585 RepID=UPI0028E52B1C|nr:ATP-binding protein [Bacillus sp. DTU_2020_1000418_1_SI_GHA_SEK_038]WNS76699.1 ATP-binding protein [Bacillus sp. DTU_2020_1000418_1_SI_GHA_SEK_038]
MKKGIKKRLVWSYLILIIFTVVLYETIILSALYTYYMGGVKQALRDQGSMFSTFYEQYFESGNLSNQAEQLLSQYHFNIGAQVQIIDSDGTVLANTHDQGKLNLAALEDVKSGLNGTTGYWVGDNGGEQLLAVTQPILVGNEPIGAVRFISSIDNLYSVFIQNSMMLAGIGIIVILLVTCISYFLAASITKPISTITLAAEQMAAGFFATRIPKKKDDEIGKLADTLNFMAREVEKHEKLKNEFIASVSHELRTPLTSVKGWAVTLHSLSEDQMFKEGLEIISSESDRLNLMLGDLLDLSSLSTGKVEFLLANIDLSKLIREVAGQLHPRAERQKVNLEVIRMPEALIVKLDRNRMKQVLINILDNALKFTPQNGRITVRVERKEGITIIEIADTGKGIPPDDLPAITKKFYKGKYRGAGTGLGLAICYEIIQAHGGNLELNSKVGEGTTATISLPHQ